MNRLPITLAAALLSLPLTAAVLFAPVAASAQAGDQLTASINADNAARLTGFVADRTDKTVTLKLTITPGTPADFKAKHYMAELDGDLFIVFKQQGADEIQVGAPKSAVKQVGGAWVLNGTFKVEYAGMNQGILAYYLRPAG